MQTRCIPILDDDVDSLPCDVYRSGSKLLGQREISVSDGGLVVPLDLAPMLSSFLSENPAVLDSSGVETADMLLSISLEFRETFCLLRFTFSLALLRGARSLPWPHVSSFISWVSPPPGFLSCKPLDCQQSLCLLTLGELASPFRLCGFLWGVRDCNTLTPTQVKNARVGCKLSSPWNGSSPFSGSILVHGASNSNHHSTGIKE